MKNILKNHIGEVVSLWTDTKEFCIGLIVKVYDDDNIVKLNVNHYWHYIRIENIRSFSSSNEKIEDHVCKSAFT